MAKTIDIHLGISPLAGKSDIEGYIEEASGTLIGGRKYELFQDEGKDDWQVWGEARENWDDPWHLIIRVEYPEGLFNVIIHLNYREFEAILGDWLRELEYEGEQLIAVITDSDDWSVYRRDANLWFRFPEASFDDFMQAQKL